MRKKDIKYLHALAAKRGGFCLSTEYNGNKKKYLWKCTCGHEWLAKANNIQQNQWCPKCYGNKVRDISWLHELAVKNGGVCISVEYIDANTKYEWECNKCNYKWWSTAASVYSGKWCLVCSGKMKHNPSWLHKIGAKINSTCLSVKYINVSTKYEWECNKCNYKWSATANNVNQGQGCPKCVRKISKLEQCLYSKVLDVHPDALPNKRGLLETKRFELDIYVPHSKKAIEFDGFRWHNSDWAIRHGAHKRDARKNQECKKAGIQILRVSDIDWVADPKAVTDKVLKFLEAGRV